MPVSIGVQWPSELEAKACRKGDLHLEFCNSCGFIWNVSFDEKLLEYSQKYDNSLDYSPVFQAYADDLAKRLITTYNIHQKQVVELGCGKGHFLSLLCELGSNKGVGFDPSYEGERIDSPVSDRIEYIQDFYGDKYTDRAGELVCCRHVLEHIKDPVGFLASTRRTVDGKKDTIVYFEVPNVRLILEKLSVWDIIYEHCNYFSLESLTYLFQQEGFDILNSAEAYQEQFLGLEASLSNAGEKEPSQAWGNLSQLTQLVESFAKKLNSRVEFWKERLKRYRDEGKKVVIWGAGAKTVGFVNMLKVDSSIKFAVDINPHKQGLHIAGTGQEIIPPERLVKEQPDIVILMNPIYKGEIEKQLRSMNLEPVLVDA